MSQRITRLNGLLKQEISTILLKEEGFDRNVLVTITRVDVSPNLSEAKVFVSVMPEERKEEVLNSLKERVYRIQQGLNKKLCLKKIPKIVFWEEGKVKEAGRIEELISEIHKDDN